MNSTLARSLAGMPTSQVIPVIIQSFMRQNYVLWRCNLELWLIVLNSQSSWGTITINVSTKFGNDPFMTELSGSN